VACLSLVLETLFVVNIVFVLQSYGVIVAHFFKKVCLLHQSLVQVLRITSLELHLTKSYVFTAN